MAGTRVATDPVDFKYSDLSVWVQPTNGTLTVVNADTLHYEPTTPGFTGYEYAKVNPVDARGQNVGVWDVHLNVVDGVVPEDNVLIVGAVNYSFYRVGDTLHFSVLNYREEMAGPLWYLVLGFSNGDEQVFDDFDGELTATIPAGVNSFNLHFRVALASDPETFYDGAARGNSWIQGLPDNFPRMESFIYATRPPGFYDATVRTDGLDRIVGIAQARWTKHRDDEEGPAVGDPGAWSNLANLPVEKTFSGLDTAMSYTLALSLKTPAGQVVSGIAIGVQLENDGSYVPPPSDFDGDGIPDEEDPTPWGGDGGDGEPA